MGFSWERCAHYYQKSILYKFKSLFSRDLFLDRFNHIDIILIPTEKHQVTLVDYKPIELCNTIYKILAKLLCNRMVPLFLELIAKNQSAFLKNKLAVGNAMIGLEVISQIQALNPKPLSPLLFVICMETLNVILTTSLGEKWWKSARIENNGIKITYLAYADDTILFAYASNKRIEDIFRRHSPSLQ